MSACFRRLRDEHVDRVVAEVAVLALGGLKPSLPVPTSVSVSADGSRRSASSRAGEREHADDQRDDERAGARRRPSPPQHPRSLTRAG